MRTLLTTALALALLGGAARAETTERSIEDRVSEIASASLPPELAIVSVSLSRSIAAADSEGATVSVDWRRSPSAGIVPVKVTVRAPRHKPRTGWARLSLARREAVVVAARPLTAGHFITAGDLEVTLAPKPKHAIGTSAEAMIGMRVLANVAGGAPILTTYVAEPPPVARGTNVTIVIERGRLRVDTRGITETAARVGTSVPVRLAGSRRVIRGRLVDRNRVTVELE